SVGTGPGAERTSAVRADRVCMVPPDPSHPPHTNAGYSLRPYPACRDGSSVDHARADGDAGRLVDQNERTGRAVLFVRVAQQRLCGTQLDPADLVEAELAGLQIAVQRIDVEPVLDVLDDRAACLRGVL